MVAMMSSCTEEKTFVIDSYFGGTVNFEIENVQLGERSIARSVEVDGSGYSPRGNRTTFDIPVYFGFNPNAYEMSSVYSDGENVVLAGGNNELVLRFIPQCPEEVSAHFTMPWGKEYNLTAKDSAVNILINRDLMQEPMDWDLVDGNYMVIKAESQYKKDDRTYFSSGYVLIQIMHNLEYVGSEGKWYSYEWMHGDLELKGNCNFYARNLSVGESDFASTTWDEGYGYYPTGYRNDNFSLPIYHLNDDGTKTNTGHTREFNLEYENLLWAGMNNEVQFIFRSSGTGEDNARLTLPDGNVIDFTRQDSTYVWAVPNDIVSTSGRNPVVVTAESEFARGGVKHFNKGYMLIDVNTDMYYDKSDDTWLWGQ